MPVSKQRKKHKQKLNARKESIKSAVNARKKMLLQLKENMINSMKKFGPNGELLLQETETDVTTETVEETISDAVIVEEEPTTNS